MSRITRLVRRQRGRALPGGLARRGFDLRRLRAHHNNNAASVFPRRTKPGWVKVAASQSEEGDPPQPMQTSGTHKVRYSDFDAIAAMLDSRVTAAVPLRKGPFLLEAAGIGLGDISVQIGRNSPLLVQGALPANLAWAVLPLSRDRPILLNGRHAGPRTMVTYGAGASHEGANHAEARWAFLVLQTSVAERLCEPPGRSPVLRPGRHAALACDPGAWRRAAQLLRAAVDVAVRDPEVFDVPEARRSLRASVLEVLQDLVSGGCDGAKPRLLRSSPERQRLLRAIDDYLKAHPGPAPTADELTTALAVSAPRLRRAVRTSFGIGLQRYILLRRLTLLRAALRSAGPGGRPAREIALAHGFWHLGRLAEDYRAVFKEDLGGLLGETPQQRDMRTRRASAR